MKDKIKQFMRENSNYSVFNAETFEMLMNDLQQLADKIGIIDFYVGEFVAVVHELFESEMQTIRILRKGRPDLVSNVDEENYDRVLEETIKLYGAENVRGSRDDK